VTSGTTFLQVGFHTLLQGHDSHGAGTAGTGQPDSNLAVISYVYQFYIAAVSLQ
jgi:hypothetical protein